MLGDEFYKAHKQSIILGGLSSEDSSQKNQGLLPQSVQIKKMRLREFKQFAKVALVASW